MSVSNSLQSAPVVSQKKHRRIRPTCTCKAYPFPHRSGSGKCYGDDAGPFCGSCGEPCRPTDVDFGIGSYEYWGFKGVDTNVQTVSDCCEASLFSDASLTKEYCHDDF